MKYVFLNHKFIKAENAHISIHDRGFKFGDGVFETMRIKDYLVQDLELHLLRLQSGLEAIKITLDLTKIENYISLLIKKNQQKDGILRLIVTRGAGSIGYLPKKNIKPTLLIETTNLVKTKLDNIELIISSYKKPSLKALPVNFKLLQGLNSTLAKLAATEMGYADGVLTDEQNHILETSSANIFLIKNGKIFTPAKELAILNGVIRSKIINKFTVLEKKIKLKELKKYDLIFITNVAIEIVQVKNITNQKNNKSIWQAKPKIKSTNIFQKINNLFLQN